MWSGHLVLGWYCCLYSTQAAIQSSVRQHTIKALDCRSPTRVLSWSWGQMCTEPKEGFNTDFVDKVDVMLLQEDTMKKIRAGRCSRRTTRLVLYCGAYSHSKLTMPPDILQYEPLTLDQCQTLVHSNTYYGPGKSVIHVPMNGRGVLKGYEHGSVTFGPYNTECVGADVIIDGERHTSVVVYTTTVVELTETTLISQTGKLTDTDSRINIPSTCINTAGCVYGDYTYVLLEVPSQCNLYEVRTISATVVSLPHDSVSTQYYVNTEHKIIVRQGDLYQVQGCAGLPQVYKTEYDGLLMLILTGSTRPTLPPVQAETISMDMQIRTSEEYIMYRTEQLLRDKFKLLGHRVCRMNFASLKSLERSPFHKNALIRIRGQLIQELTCKEVQVTATEGDTRGECYDNLLPVTLEGIPLFLDAVSMVVVEDSTLHQVACSEMYTAVVQTDAGIFLSANPEVQTVEVKTSPLETSFLHLEAEATSHEEESSDLLYTKSEISAFRELLHFQRTRNQVLDGLVRGYCKVPTACSYQSSGPGGFDVRNLLSNSLDDLSWQSWVLKYLGIIGQGASVLVVLYLGLGLVKSLGQAVLDGRKYQVSVREAWKLNSSVKNELKVLVYQKFLPEADHKNDESQRPVGEQAAHDSLRTHPESRISPLSLEHS